MPTRPKSNNQGGILYVGGGSVGEASWLDGLFCSGFVGDSVYGVKAP
jgi:hypothetical protein